MISIPAPPRGASPLQRPAPVDMLFQYQPLHEGLPEGKLRRAGRRHFNTSPSTRGFRKHLPESRAVRYFNTSPSTRGFGNEAHRAACDKISIPAPPRGASFFDVLRSQGYGISIPAPPRGASELDSMTFDRIKFQYQPLHEGLRGSS